MDFDATPNQKTRQPASGKGSRRACGGNGHRARGMVRGHAPRASGVPDAGATLALGREIGGAFERARDTGAVRRARTALRGGRRGGGSRVIGIGALNWSYLFWL